MINGQHELLCVDDLVDYLRVPRSTLYAWRSRGGGPPGIKVGRHVRYRRNDVEKWLDERKAAPERAELAVRTGRGDS